MHTSQRSYKKIDPSTVGYEIGTNIQFVVENSLCHGCGTCEAVCPEDAISTKFIDTFGFHLPEIEVNKCTDCELCVEACSGFELDLTNRKFCTDKLLEHDLVGPHVDIYRSHSNNEDIRNNAASGGVITEIIAYLFEKKQIDGAVVTRMNETQPTRGEGYIAKTFEDLIASQKSKYCPVPLNTILKPFIQRKIEGKFVFVGLPHHIHGLRLAQNLFPHLNDIFILVLSSFTAHVPSQRATDFILYKNKIAVSEVKTLEYRGGGNPGRMRIVKTNGEEILIPHLHWTYSGHSFPLFFYPVREWLYFDKLSEWSDISFGDNWSAGLKEQNGASSVVTRSLKADTLINEMINLKRLTATNMTCDELVKDQVLKTKLNIYWRLKVWKAIGRKIPIYNRKFEVLKGQLLRTLRFAVYIKLCERAVPYSLMNRIISLDYYLRAIPMRKLKKILEIFGLAINMFLPASTDKLVKKKKNKLVLIGGYGHFDIGDEAMPHAVRLNIREEFGDDLELVMLSPCPECTFEMHGEKSNFDFTYISHGPNASILRQLFTFSITSFLLFAVVLEKIGIRLRLWKTARAALDEISSADAIINVGGGNINSVIPGELYKKCTTYIIAHLLNKPVFLSGQTMGPYYGLISKFYARYAINKVKMITFRDKDVSKIRLNQLGVNRPEMFDAADDSISLKGIDSAKARTLLEKETNIPFDKLKSKLIVVLNMKASLNIFKGKDRSSDLNSEIELMAIIADKLIENYSANVILLPTDFSDAVDDRVPHKQIYEKITHKDSAYMVTGQYIDDELIGMIACADVAIGARYHFNVFAALKFIPFLGIASGIYQRTKLQGLANLCGLEYCYVDHDMEFVKAEVVWPYIEKVIDNRVAV